MTRGHEDNADPVTARSGAVGDAAVARRVTPWLLSITAHLALVIIGFTITWVVISSEEEAPVRILSEFDIVEYEPIEELSTEIPEPETAPSSSGSMETLVQDLDQIIDLDLSGVEVLVQGRNLEILSPTGAGEGTTRFAGLATSRANRIIFVIDASGSMIRGLPIVLEELTRTLDLLEDDQYFGVIFFQGNEAIPVPPLTKALTQGVDDERERVLEWIRRHVVPEGRSNPMKALKLAIRNEPDVIYLLSEDITGSGQWEISAELLLEELAALNPVVASTGQRRVRIQCVQFLDPDPLGTMRRIADMHGGRTGYKFLDRGELGLHEQY